MKKNNKKVSLEKKFGARVKAIGLLRYGEIYYNAFLEILTDSSQTYKFYPANHYLAAHSMELSMKAILRHEKYSLDELQKKFGHNLLKLAKELEKRGFITFPKKEMAVLKLVSPLYKEKQFEYILVGVKDLPSDESLHFTTSSILQKAKTYLLAKRAKLRVLPLS